MSTDDRIRARTLTGAYCYRTEVGTITACEMQLTCEDAVLLYLCVSQAGTFRFLR